MEADEGVKMKRTGKLIQGFRKEKHITAKQLCEGICTSAFMSQIENGEKEPDVLLFECLMERIGISPEDFSIMMTDEEYNFFSWRENVYNSIEKREWENVNRLLIERKNSNVGLNEKITKQIYCYIEGVIAASQEKWESATDCIKRAIIQTNPQIFSVLDRNVVLGTKEVHLLMLYIYYGVLGQKISRVEGVALLHKLELYITKGRMELYEQAKLYPKLVCIMLHVFESEITIEEKIKKCESAVLVLRKTRRFYDITELLRLYIPLLELVQSNEVAFFKKQKEVFDSLYIQGNIDASFRPEHIVVQKIKIYLIPEYLYTKRKEKNLTHEQISEDIYEVASYSRVERGKTKPFPRKLEKLVERLEIPWCRYRWELESDNIEAYRLKKRCRELSVMGRKEDALVILDRLESLLDMNLKVNFQYIQNERLFLLSRLKKISIDEAYLELKRILEITMKLSEDTSCIVYYSQVELEIIVCMAQMLQKMKQYEVGIELIEKILEKMTNSKVCIEQQWYGVDFALRILSSIYFKIGNYEKSLRISSYVLEMAVKIRAGGNLSPVLDAIADSLEHMGKQYSERYKELYRQTYYVADFFEIESIIPFAKHYYEENFENNYKWY